MSRFFNERLRELTPYTPGEQPQGLPRLIKLNTNENPYPPSPQVVAALDAAALNRLRLYPDPECGELRQAAAQVYGLEPQQIMAGNGSDELLAFCFQAFGGAGMVVPDISYGFYPVFAALYGVKTQVVPLAADLSLRVEDYAGKQGTVLIADPNAPTGLALGREQLRALLEQDRRRLVIIDEAYADFAAASAIDLLPDYDNLLIVRTLSKSYSLAGARLGLAFGSPELIADLNRIKYSFNPYNVSQLAQTLGTAALLDGDYFRECRDKVLKSRDRLRRGLLQLGFSVPESSANFLLAGEHPCFSGAELAEALRGRQILVRYFDIPRLRAYVRISVGTEPETDALLQAISELIAAKQKGLIL